MNELKKVFTKIYESNDWGSKESISGLGSELSSTKTIREEIPQLIHKFKIKSFLDIPCGDFNWISQIDFKNTKYIGADIVEELINKNNKKFPDKDFMVLDITQDQLPEVDLIFVRDLLGHFSYDNIQKAIDNILFSNSKYLLTTSFTKWDYNVNIKDGDWRPINLLIKPFKFKPIYLINENCTEGSNLEFNDKCLILFDLKSLQK